MRCYTCRHIVESPPWLWPVGDSSSSQGLAHPHQESPSDPQEKRVTFSHTHQQVAPAGALSTYLQDESASAEWNAATPIATHQSSMPDRTAAALDIDAPASTVLRSDAYTTPRFLAHGSWSSLSQTPLVSPANFMATDAAEAHRRRVSSLALEAAAADQLADRVISSSIASVLNQ